MAPPKAEIKRGGFSGLDSGVKGVLLILILGFVGGAYYFGLHASLEEEVSAAQSRFNQVQAELAQAQERQREYLRLREELAAREPLDRANARVLPEQAETASFVRDLNRLAELSGIQIRKIEPRPEEPEEHFTRLPVALAFKGRFHQLGRFLYNVSRLERVISMENLQLKDPQLEGEDLVLSVELLATTFKRPTPPETPGGPT